VSATVEVFARRLWADELGGGGRALRLAAAPLSWAWGGLSSVVGARRAGRAVQVDGVTVISVGNLAVGGTGKTPLVDWIAKRVQESGRQPAVLVGGAARDEAALHGQRLPDVPVIQSRDRVQAARDAARDGAGVAILDDGFQHRRLHRDLDVVLLSAEDAFPGSVLPAGPYRERPRALERADAILVTRRRASRETARELAGRVARYAPEGAIACVELALEGWRRLTGDLADCPDTDVVAACAIARPEGFRSAVALRVRGSVELVAFPDHHEYTPGDLQELDARRMGRPLVITEKDAVKLRDHADRLGDTFVLCEEVRWDSGEAAFRARLGACLEHGG